MEKYLDTDAGVLRALIEESPTPMGLYTGLEMRIYMANKAMYKNTWGKSELVIGKTVREALPELEGQPFHQLLHDVYTTGVAYEATEDLVKIVVDGVLQDFYYNFTYKPLKGTDGQVWGILNTATDVTALVLARRRADEAEEHLEYALQAANVGTWNLDITNNKVTWDNRTKQLYGFSKDDKVAYDQVLKYIHPEDRPAVETAVGHAIDFKSGGTYDIKFRTIGADDQKLRWLHCLGKAYFDENNQPYRFSGIAQDISDIVQADAKINSAEQLAQLAVETIGAGSFIIDLTNDDMTYTPLFAKVFTGLERTDFIRADFVNQIHPDDRLKRQHAYNIAAKTGNLLYEARFIWHDGSIHWARTKGKYLFDELNKPIKFIGLAYDITAEEEAREEQRKLLWLIDNSNDFISLSDWNGKLTYLNKTGRQMMGFDSMEEALRQNTEYVLPEEADRIKNEVNPALLKDGRWKGHIIYQNFKTGERIPAYATTLLFKDTTTGQPLGRATVVRDLRPELAAQKALRDSEALFRGITTASPAALWMSDDKGSITYVNQIWINWTGRNLEEHLGEGWLDSVHPKDLQQVAEKFLSDFTDRKFHESFFRIKHSDGSTRWVVCTGNPQYQDDGTFAGYIGACVDMTEQKQMQQQKDEFIGVASHELKTPVTSIKAYTQVLEAMFTRDGDSKKAAMLGKMNSQLDRLTSLIGDLLDVTKIQSGRLQFNDDDFDFNQLVVELIEDLQRTTTRHEIVLQLGHTGLVFADKDRIGQVITNLVTNAIKYSPNANKIIVSTSLVNNEINLCVQDFGIGISADKQDRVFEQFYRVSGDQQHTFPGLGLGLYISSEIIKREGGRIWVSSAEGQGSTFCFALPLK
ncbi:PAS domain S-box protein [Mucilaginibacter lacusdianchii]|uniref:PAS domain S-box protein n=1 Tax=Mucilaginibacter lacusdianchii TaxID=2684211 RepID=UPI00131E2CE2|nr:PAS domain S-box protein [Mucilaginibacter sp. JXJ CY 39]